MNNIIIIGKLKRCYFIAFIL